jgi:hypothetical protein
MDKVFVFGVITFIVCAVTGISTIVGAIILLFCGMENDMIGYFVIVTSLIYLFAYITLSILAFFIGE